MKSRKANASVKIRLIILHALKVVFERFFIEQFI